MTHEKEYDEIISSYLENYEKGNNIVDVTTKKFVEHSDIVCPEISEDDDPFNYLIKKMVLDKQLSKKWCKTQFDEPYQFDNLVSGLNGSTKTMVITKFMRWCQLVNVDWEFTLVDNDDDAIYPLKEKLFCSNTQELTCEFGDQNPDILKIPLIEEGKHKDDPLKRLIKVALIKKSAPRLYYTNRCSSTYLLNNMVNALRSTSKMMVPYFLNWCEILGLNYILKIIDPETKQTWEANVYYKMSTIPKE